MELAQLNPSSNTTNLSSDLPQNPNVSAEHQTLQIDFSWRKWKALITRKDDPDSTPLYIINFKAFSKPQLIFTSPSDDSTIGTGSIHTISISPTCVVHDHPITLQALKRLKTSYTHLSPAFSVDGVTPMRMTWTSTGDLKTWDFICLDDKQMPVARFSANIWAVKKLALLEFLGDHKLSDAVRDEIVVMGATLFWGMAVRIQNPLNLVGSMVDKVGNVEKDGESRKDR